MNCKFHLNRLRCFSKNEFVASSMLVGFPSLMLWKERKQRSRFEGTSSFASPFFLSSLRCGSISANEKEEGGWSMNQISPFTSIIKEAWCVCGVSSIKFTEKTFWPPTRGAKNTRTREKKKKEESKFFKKESLSRESERERGRLVARRASKEGRRQERRAARVLFYRRAFLFFARRVVSWGFRKRLKVVSSRKVWLFFFPRSWLTSGGGDTHGKKDGRKSLEVNGTEENPHRTH